MLGRVFSMLGVKHEENHVGIGEDFVGADLREEVERITLIRGAPARRVDEDEFGLRAVRLGASQARAYRIAGGASDFTDDETGTAE